MERRFLALVAMVIILAVPAVAQTSVASGQWTGSIQCQLDVQLQGYVRHEIQTWTLTGEPPKTFAASGFATYPATWTYTGQGGIQRMDGQQMKVFQWAINVTPGEAPFNFVVSNGVLIIRRTSAPQSRTSGFTGTRQVAVNGVPQLPAPMTSLTLWEWALPWIEAGSATTITGTMPAPTTGFSGGEVAPPVSAPPPSATCKYQFFSTNDSGLTASANAAQSSNQSESSVSTGLKQLGHGGGSIQQVAQPQSSADGVIPPSGQTNGAMNGLPPAPPVGTSQKPECTTTQFPSWDQTIPTPARWIRLANFNNQAVLDRNTGLVWETTPEHLPMSWAGAREHCFERVVGGQMGFRLPSVSELTTLLNPSAPAGISKVASPNSFDFGARAPLDFIFWSGSSENTGSRSYAYRVDISKGTVRRMNTEDLNLPHDALGIGGSTLTAPTGNVWCVRGGLNPAD